MTKVTLEEIKASNKSKSTIIAFVNDNSKLELTGAIQGVFDLFATDVINIEKFNITIGVEFAKDRKSPLWSLSTDAKHTTKGLSKFEQIQEDWVEEYIYTDVLYINL